MTSTLRVATYNIHHGADGRGRLDLPRIAATLAALRADVIGLQEVDVGFSERSAFEDQAARLAELLGLQGCFGAAIDLAPAAGGGRRRQYGLALLSPHEITTHTMHPLAGHPALGELHEPRGVLRASVLPEGQEPLQVMITHLDHDDRRHRTAQVLRILELSAAREHSTAPEHSATFERSAAFEVPSLLLGDMNADPSSPELAPLAASGWREAAADIRGALPRSAATAQLTAALPWGRAAGRATFPARVPQRRIDSIWSRGGLLATGLEVGSSRASDHRPLVASFRRVPAER